MSSEEVDELITEAIRQDRRELLLAIITEAVKLTRAEIPFHWMELVSAQILKEKP